MKTLCFVILVLFSSPCFAQTTYSLSFSTYLGGANEDTIRDVAVDGQGYIYITGGTQSPTFPTTLGAYDTTHNGNMDVFVAKLSPSGQLIWSTFVGGPNYDRAYAIEVDAQGFVYLTGRAGRGFPIVKALQPTFQGYNTGALYGEQNAFIAKLSPDGSALVFSTYFGTWDGHRDMAIDRDGDIYVAGGFDPTKTGPLPSAWFTNAYKKLPSGRDCYVAKIRSDGSQVLWATYFGGSGIEAAVPSIRVDSQKRPILLSSTTSTDLPTTSGAYDATFNGVWDMFLVKFTADGSGLIFSTYFGGNNNEFTETHGLAIDSNDNVIAGFTTLSTNMPVSSNAFQRVYSGSGGPGTGDSGNYPGDAFIAKFSTTGQFLAGTYLGGSVGEGLEGISTDQNGNIIVSGATYSANFPVTANGFQRTKGNSADFFLSKISPDLSQLIYSTFLGGNADDFGRTSISGPNGEMIVAGMTSSINFPVISSIDNSQNGGIDSVLTKIAVVTSGQILPNAPSIRAVK